MTSPTSFDAVIEATVDGRSGQSRRRFVVKDIPLELAISQMKPETEAILPFAAGVYTKSGSGFAISLDVSGRPSIRERKKKRLEAMAGFLGAPKSHGSAGVHPLESLRIGTFDVSPDGMLTIRYVAEYRMFWDDFRLHIVPPKARIYQAPLFSDGESVGFLDDPDLPVELRPIARVLEHALGKARKTEAPAVSR